MKKITDNQIREIRQRYSNGASISKLSKHYNITGQTVRNIIHCKGCYRSVI